MDPGGGRILSRPQEIFDQPASDGGTAPSRAIAALSGSHPSLSWHHPSGTKEGTPDQRPLQDTQPPSKTQHPQDNASGASTDPVVDIPPEVTVDRAVTEGPEGGPQEGMEGPHPNEEQDSTAASPLIEHPVYFVSTVLREARASYPMPQKLILVLPVASRKLCHYLQGHPIKVVSVYPLERVLRSPNAAGRVAEWNIELQAFNLEFSTTRVIKGAALTDFMAECTDIPGRGVSKDGSLLPGDEEPDGWVMYFDGSFA